MIRYLLCTMFFGVLALAQSIADVVIVNDENSSNEAFSLVEDRIKKMQSVRILDKAILENIQNPFGYDNASKQDLPALGGSRENSIKVLIGSKIKVGESWLSKGDSIGTTKIVDIKTDGVLLEEKDGNIFTKQLKKEKIDGLEIK
ncbi:MAG: hypothetical protein SPE49_06165 [Campylobacter sp.]|uniref:hypothetical protein n=1 Tax=Campylobacter sp. TaxID=205 RepID=UPI002A803D07|nr:hypothetical protein [Campylobacter sp.]MDY5115535.1 hypothetical protein [Campylobacter sp.]